MHGAAKESDGCQLVECEGRLSQLETMLVSTKQVADKAAADVDRIERDVDRIGSEMRRIRAVMVGSDEGERGGLRADVQALAAQMDKSQRNQVWTLRMLGALLLLLSPDQIVKIVTAVHQWATKTAGG